MPVGVWSLFTIAYQTFLCILLSWLTLGCRLSPDSSELHEVTILKLLYLYDPVACGRMHFYNFTTRVTYTQKKLMTAVVWPISNRVATSFRSKIQVWLALHLLWFALGVANISQGNRTCAFYVTLIPFTLTGSALLVVDLVFAGLFLADAKSTSTEMAILYFINSNSGKVGKVNSAPSGLLVEDDTSWISVLLAYISARGVVQWIINFWIVKDSYFEGRANYHRLQYQNARNKSCSKNSQYPHHIQV